jgi:hypothetical protein
MFAVPGLGQVQGDVPVAVAGGAGGDVDEVAADGSAAGLGVGEAGQGPGSVPPYRPALGGSSSRSGSIVSIPSPVLPAAGELAASRP